MMAKSIDNDVDSAPPPYSARGAGFGSGSGSGSADTDGSQTSFSAEVKLSVGGVKTLLHLYQVTNAQAGTCEVDGKINLDIDRILRRGSRFTEPDLQSLYGHMNSESLPTESPDPKTTSGPCPPLNIVVQIVGSRGDVQPFVALALALKKFGHRVRFATHPVFRDFVEKLGIEFFSIGGDPTALMNYMVQNPGVIPELKSIRDGEIERQMRAISQILVGCWHSCFKGCDCSNDSGKSFCQAPSSSCWRKPAFVADVIIANPPSFAHIHCAEKLGIPLHIMFTMPWSSTRMFPHPLVNLRSSKTESGLANYMSYTFFEAISWQGLGSVVNDFRSRRLGLERLDTVSAITMMRRARVPHTYCWSESLIPKPADWDANTSVAGFFLLPQRLEYQPPSSLEDFLAKGPSPVYIGFGSIVVEEPDKLTEMIFEAVRIAGVRALVSKGWGGFGGAGIAIPPDVYMLGDCPHAWLFPRVRSLVHHGGAGTTATGLAAGKPAVIVPFFGDQPFWGDSVFAAGAGPRPIPWKTMTATRLADAILATLNPEMDEAARTMGNRLREEEGTSKGVEKLHCSLPIDAMTCSILSDRPAVWKFRHADVQVSAAVAELLRSEGFLKQTDLTLLRVCKYNLNTGPWDPISGGSKAIWNLFFNTFKGIAEIGSEFANKPYFGEVSSSSRRDIDQQAIEPTAKPLSDSDTTRGNPKDREVVGVKAARGLGRIVQSAARAPMYFTVAMAHGAHNAPRLWGDTTVRPQKKVTGIVSGISAGCQELVLGTYDGISGLVRLPINGAREDGALGFAKGIAQGIVGLPVKFWAGMSGITGYPMQGVDAQIKKAFVHDDTQDIRRAREAQGRAEYAGLSEDEKAYIRTRWPEIIG